MKAARLHAIGDFRIDEVSTPKPSGEQLLLKVGACGICGSDIPRIYELGTSKQTYPLTIGHEFGGEIVAVGEKADDSLVGKRGAIFPCIPCFSCSSCLTADYCMCLDYDYLGSRSDGGFADYCIIPSVWNFVPSNNPNTSMEALSMVEPCTVAQHAIRKSGLTAGHTLLIFGAGPIGIMAARWAKIFGVANVALVDIAEDKIQFAQERGFVAFNGIKQDIPAECVKLFGDKADIVIEGTGVGSALGQCIESVKTFGTVVLMGNPHRDTTISLNQHSNILRKELRLQGIWNSHYASTPINEWTFTVTMLDRGLMVVDDLVTHKCNLDELKGLCDDIKHNRVSMCKALCLL